MINTIKNIIPKNLKNKIININNNYFDGYSTKSYSQEGEDSILKRIFSDKKDGFYIDIGAHHPVRFSNTYAFYKSGWTGINIDAMPGSMNLFNKKRKNDINIEAPISDKEESIMYYSFNEPALNGFSSKLSSEREEIDNYKIISKIKLKTNTLSTILDKHLPENKKIDFMSIDVEGFDLKVLKSNNWEKYKPDYILIEILNSSLEDLSKSEEHQYLSGLGYSAFAKTINTTFFISRDIL